MKDLIQDYKNGKLSLRQVIYNCKNYKEYTQELVENTKFLDLYKNTRDISVEERLYYVINDIKEPIICESCGKLKTFSGRIRDGYRNSCSSSECKSKMFSKVVSERPKNILSNRIKSFIEWQESINSDTKIDDNTIKNFVKFSNLDIYVKNKWLLEYLNNRFKDSASLYETIDRIKKGIEEKPKCPVCGRPVNYVGKKSKMFTTYCSNTCAGKSEEVIKKKAMTDMAKNGGVRGWTLSNSSKEKIEKRKKTMIERYGTLNPTLIPGVSDKIHDTCKKKFGYECVMQNPEIRIKKNNTEKLNGYSKISKYENHFKNVLEEVFNTEVNIQYLDERYPYKCDFYIKNFDLFIELNCSQYHHFHPFDFKNQEDLDELKRLNEKAEEIRKNGKRNQYDQIIYVWTILDPMKRKNAELNNVKLLELWAEDDNKNIKAIKEYLELYEQI